MNTSELGWRKQVREPKATMAVEKTRLRTVHKGKF